MFVMLKERSMSDETSHHNQIPVCWKIELTSRKKLRIQSLISHYKFKSIHEIVKRSK